LNPDYTLQTVGYTLRCLGVPQFVFWQGGDPTYPEPFHKES